MLATIRDDTWNMLNMQRINPISKKWDYSDIPGGGHKQIKGPAHMVEGDHYLRKAPNPHPQNVIRIHADTEILTQQYPAGWSAQCPQMAWHLRGQDIKRHSEDQIKVHETITDVRDQLNQPLWMGHGQHLDLQMDMDGSAQCVWMAWYMGPGHPQTRWRHGGSMRALW